MFNNVTFTFTGAAYLSEKQSIATVNVKMFTFTILR